MGDTGGRSLIFSLHSLETNDEQDIRLLAEAIPDMFLNLSGFENPSNFNPTFSDPITSAKVTSLLGRDSYAGARPSEPRYSGTSKPVYVQADILERHLGTGKQN
jgi:hypothetical protein